MTNSPPNTRKRKRNFAELDLPCGSGDSEAGRIRQSLVVGYFPLFSFEKVIDESWNNRLTGFCYDQSGTGTRRVGESNASLDSSRRYFARETGFPREEKYQRHNQRRYYANVT